MIDEEKILAICKEVAGNNTIISSCFYGSRVCGYAKKDSDYDVLLILKDYRNGVKYHYKKLNNMQIAILKVDKEAFEQDSEKGLLGDFVTGRLLGPYTAFLNPKYMKKIEIQTKKRVIEEELKNLVLEYEELARGLVIKPEYFALARMWKRAKIHPLLKYSYTSMMTKKLRKKNMYTILNGYVQALKDLDTLKILRFENGNITIENRYVNEILSRKMILDNVVNILELSRKVFNAYIAHGKAGYVSLDIVLRELTSKFRRELQMVLTKAELEEPKNYLFLNTTSGLLNLNQKASLTQVIYRLCGEKKFKVSPLPGVLNEVWLIKINESKMVAKKFTDWYNFKWFLLNLAAHGTKFFILSGKKRLFNEYGINRSLAEKGIPVPTIFSISLSDRLLIEEYIDGTSALDLVKETFKIKQLTMELKETAFKLGKTLARIHSVGVNVGDCKPENFIIGTDKKVYILDLEQAERTGDKIWDIAEFLYFAGHYGHHMTNGFKQFIEAFIKGYSEVGDSKILKGAASLRYTKVFVVWTPMPILQKITELLDEL